jgi:hypothetical protein
MTTAIEPFGHGIVCPFQRDSKGDFAHDAGRRLLASDIGELFGILGPAGATGGEVPWRMELGSRLSVLRHRHVHSEMVRATAEAMTAGVIQRWEPRVRLGPTAVEPGDDGVSINVRLSYTPIGDRQGAVYYDYAVKE